MVMTVLECSQSSKQQQQNRSPSAVEKGEVTAIIIMRSQLYYNYVIVYMSAKNVFFGE